MWNLMVEISNDFYTLWNEVIEMMHVLFPFVFCFFALSFFISLFSDWRKK